MKLIEVDRKSRILTRAQFGCLRNAYTLNITKGCEFTCVYCYARGYPDSCARQVLQMRKPENILKKKANS